MVGRSAGPAARGGRRAPRRVRGDHAPRGPPAPGAGRTADAARSPSTSTARCTGSARPGAAVVRSPGPALLVDLSVAVGDMVEAGQRVGTVEAMKTEAPLIAEVEGVVVRVLVAARDPGRARASRSSSSSRIAEGDAAEPSPVAIRPATNGTGPSPPTPTRGPGAPASSTPRARRPAARPRGRGLGRSHAARRTLDALASGDRDRDDAGWAPLVERLAMFTDVEALFERNLLLLEDHPAAVSAESAFHEACRHYHRGEDGVRPELRPLLAAAMAPLTASATSSRPTSSGPRCGGSPPPAPGPPSANG